MQYGAFDPASSSPHPIIGWYDTDAFDYPNLPANIAEATSIWSDRLAKPWGWDADASAWIELSPPPPPPQAEHAARIAQGVTATCTSNTDNSAVYPLDDRSFGILGSVARDSAAGLGLPDDSVPPPGLSRATPVPPEAFGFPDVNGNTHALSAPQVAALYTASRDIRATLAAQTYVLTAGGTPAWPDQTATIP